MFNLLADGRSSDEIAQTTNLSPGSVKRCVGSLLLKLGVGGRVASVAAAISLGSYLSMD